MAEKGIRGGIYDTIHQYVIKTKNFMNPILGDK